MPVCKRQDAKKFDGRNKMLRHKLSPVIVSFLLVECRPQMHWIEGCT